MGDSLSPESPGKQFEKSLVLYNISCGKIKKIFQMCKSGSVSLLEQPSLPARSAGGGERAWADLGRLHLGNCFFVGKSFSVELFLCLHLCQADVGGEGVSVRLLRQCELYPGAGQGLLLLLYAGQLQHLLR